MALKKKITISTIKNMRIEDERINDTELAGFHVRISSKGAIKYYLFYRLNGKQRNYLIGSSESLTPAQARDLAKEASGLVASGQDIQIVRQENRNQGKRDNLKLRLYLDNTYLPYLESLNVKTASKAHRNLKSSFSHLLDKNICDIKAWDIQKWVSERKKSGKANATITYSLGRLKAAFNRAVEWGLLDEHDLSSVKVPKEDNTRIRYLTVQEESSLLNEVRERDQRVRNERASANDFRRARNYPLYPTFDDVAFVDYLEPLIISALHTGMRKGELLSLVWNDVYFEQRYIMVRASNAKSKKGRTIPMNDTLFNALSLWKKQVAQTQAVFVTDKGDAITDIKKPWMKLLKDANIDNFRFHDLRHHFASKLVMAGVDLNTVRELLGHADMKMTLRYAHLAPEHKAAAVNMIG
ncbi:integrase [Vibrio sp. vnigr-6D03]|uniref:tyrosine-type recombinase/integrase n=1 Tax=Vibrio sp. vnigr-6D03 TaxID=2058088 RepID=UPI000C3244A5|nr:tyrosine-type recombinase/integrase [Vibrio sp. vnigr-6D03]PKF78221.1 integrase [Vibrio sp. vnigr-6D03]